VADDVIWSCPDPGCDEDLADDGGELRCPVHGVIPDALRMVRDLTPWEGGVSDPYDCESYQGMT
jgi:hypothetical protein